MHQEGLSGCAPSARAPTTCEGSSAVTEESVEARPVVAKAASFEEPSSRREAVAAALPAHRAPQLGHQGGFARCQSGGAPSSAAPRMEVSVPASRPPRPGSGTPTRPVSFMTPEQSPHSVKVIAATFRGNTQSPPLFLSPKKAPTPSSSAETTPRCRNSPPMSPVGSSCSAPPLQRGSSSGRFFRIVDVEESHPGGTRPLSAGPASEPVVNAFNEVEGWQYSRGEELLKGSTPSPPGSVGSPERRSFEKMRIDSVVRVKFDSRPNSAELTRGGSETLLWERRR
mmetsp:Transcript_55581/g.136223  ORF Transcript_55581/g.136223 Transcript_55581/m.136223 type:complete len:283 (+) Transcript_55581:94-942(+)